MPRIPFAALLIATALLAADSLAATPGVTTAERDRAVELQKRLTSKKVADKLTLDLARIYLRRSYVVDFDPAESVITDLLAAGRRLAEADLRQYFAWALDALVRGTKPQDVKTILKRVIDFEYTGAEKAAYLEWFLGVASEQTSPLPLLDVAETAYKNGLVGARLREFIAWAITEIKRGEDPAHFKQMYDVVRKLSPSSGVQREILAKCYRNIRLGVPPRTLANALTQLGRKYESNRPFEEDLDKILRLFLAGTTFDEAVKTVIPPPPAKPPEK